MGMFLHLGAGCVIHGSLCMPQELRSLLALRTEGHWFISENCHVSPSINKVAAATTTTTPSSDVVVNLKNKNILFFKFLSYKVHSDWLHKI